MAVKKTTKASAPKTAPAPKKAATPKAAAPKKAAPKKAAAKTASAPKAAAPKKAAAKTASAPKGAAPKKAAPKTSAPKGVAPKTSAPKGAAPKTSAPKKAATPKKKAAPVKLTDNQTGLLKKVAEAKDSGYPATKAEGRVIDSLQTKKLIKRGQKTKEGNVHYLVTKTGEKHLAPAAPSKD